MTVRDSMQQLGLLPEVTPPPSVSGRFSDMYTNDHAVIGKALLKCADVIGEIQHGETQHVVSMGDWSAEHVICHVVEQCGPMRLMMATWSVSDAAVLRLAEAMAQGHITACRALLDWRVRVRRPNALTVMRSALSTADLRLDNCHAKIYLLDNDDYHVTFVGSPNLTTNPRLEASVLTESADVWKFHRGWLEPMIDGANPFDVPRPKGKRKKK
jgi:hypothetical protein